MKILDPGIRIHLLIEITVTTQGNYEGTYQASATGPYSKADTHAFTCPYKLITCALYSKHTEYI